MNTTSLRQSRGCGCCSRSLAPITLALLLLGYCATAFADFSKNLQPPIDISDTADPTPGFEDTFGVFVGIPIRIHSAYGLGPGKDAIEAANAYLEAPLESVGAQVTGVAVMANMALLYHDTSIAPRSEFLLAIDDLVAQGILETAFTWDGQQLSYVQNGELEIFDDPYPEELFPNDPRFAAQQREFHEYGGLRGPEAWALFQREIMDFGIYDDTIVAVIDSGLRLTHEDIIGNVWNNQGEVIPNDGIDEDASGCADDVNGCWFNYKQDASGVWRVIPENDVSDPPSNGKGHGTKVAGLITGTTNNGKGIAAASGIAPVQVLPIKVFHESDHSPLNMFAAVKAIDYVKTLTGLGHPIKVVNMSWGTYSTVLGLPICRALSQLTDPIDDPLFIVAAGNSAKDIDQNYLAPASCPGQILNVTAHAEISSDPDLHMHSNFGINAVAFSAISFVTTTTRASNIGYGSLLRTSGAAAVTSGVAGMLGAAFADPFLIDIVLRETAVPVDRPSFRDGTNTMGKLDACTAAAWMLLSSAETWECECCADHSCGDSDDDVQDFNDYYYQAPSPCTCIEHAEDHEELLQPEVCSAFLQVGQQLKSWDDRQSHQWFVEDSRYHETDPEWYPWDPPKDPNKANCPPSAAWTHPFICDTTAFRHCPCAEEELWDCAEEWVPGSDAGCEPMCEEDEEYAVNEEGNWLCCPPDTEWNEALQECEEEDDPSL